MRVRERKRPGHQCDEHRKNSADDRDLFRCLQSLLARCGAVCLAVFHPVPRIPHDALPLSRTIEGRISGKLPL